MVSNFDKKNIWIPKNMLICIGTDTPDRIVHLTGDPDGPIYKPNAKESRESTDRPEIL